MKKFLFVDDHAVVRESFVRILAEPFKPVEVEEAGTGDLAIEKIRMQKFDLVIMDVQMPDTDTVGLVSFIKNHSSETKILMLTMASETMHAKRYLKAGANGFISKESSLDEVTKAIDTVLAGRNYLSDKLADLLVSESLNKKRSDNPFDALSKREYEITTLLLQGKGIGDISKILNLAPSTTGTHKARIFEKIGVANIFELKDLAALLKM